MTTSTNRSVESFLRSEFSKVIHEVNGDATATAVQSWSDALILAYTEPQRHYHTTSHIYSMLKCFKYKKISTSDETAVRLAIFFHDWVYDPMAPDNELQSVKVFETFARELDILEYLHKTVSHYIEATITHSLDPRDKTDDDLKFFLDFDLEVLALEPAEYALYSSQIRKEYGHYSDDAYASGRVGVLEKFLVRERLYFSDAFYEVYEERARLNLKGEIELLKECQKKMAQN